jgi:hypothetical protein
MTARQLRWILASIAIALEVTSFVLFVTFMMRRHDAELVEEPTEGPAAPAAE